MADAPTRDEVGLISTQISDSPLVTIARPGRTEAASSTSAWGGRGSTIGDSGLNAIIFVKARDRLQKLALLMGLIYVLGAVFGGLYLTTLELSTEDTVSNLIGSGISVLAAAGLWWVARDRRFSHSFALNVGLAFMIAMCLTTALGTTVVSASLTGQPPFMSWSTPLIILVPLLIPFPPRRLLFGLLLAAATEPLALAILNGTGKVPFQPEFLGVLINPLAAVMIAYAASRMLYGMNRDMARARLMGSYQLTSLIGRGGMGEVWTARHRMLARPAAIKLIRPDVLGADADDVSELLDRFDKEVQATASLRSPHTIGIYDFGLSEDGVFYYVMELLDGMNLDALVRGHGRQPPARVVHLIKQACHSLHEAHKAGLVHRDIKPANMFLCRYGADCDFVKVLDFGLVKQLARADVDVMATGQGGEGAMVGTPAFIAPEMVAGKEPVDGRADIYALGCVMYWLVTGDLVFKARSSIEMMLKHVNDEPIPPSARLPDDGGNAISPAFDRLVLSCLAKHPADRPQTAQDLLDLLDECCDERWSPVQAEAWWNQHAA